MAIDYDSILTSSDSSIINRTEFYRQGVTLPDRTVPMSERPYTLSNDDYVVAGMAVMFFILAAVFYRSREVLRQRLKDFFVNKRQYREEEAKKSFGEVVNVFLLIAISVLSMSLICFGDWMEQYTFMAVEVAPYWLLAVGFVGGVLVIYLKAGLYALVNGVFYDGESNEKWMSGYFFLTSLTAFLLYPLALIDIFSDEFDAIVFSSTILVGVLYELLLFYKLCVNFKVKKYGYLFIFLYFCSVELIPALVVWHTMGWMYDSFIVKNLLY